MRPKATLNEIVSVSRFLVGSALALICLAIPAHGDTVYSNLGSGSTVYNSTDWDVSGPTSLEELTTIDVAMGFTPSGNFDLSEIDLALNFNGVPSETNAITVTLNADSSNAPGAILETWNLTGLPSFFGTCCTLQVLTPTSTVALNSGTQYWIEASPGASDFNGGWNWNSTGASGPFWSNISGTSEETVGAFDVLGSSVGPTVVPEPSTFVLLGLGMLGLAGIRRKLLVP